MPNQIWKIIKNHPKYQINNIGEIKSFKRYKNGKILRPRKNNMGYFYIRLHENKIVFTKLIHVLLFETFNDYELKSDECIHHKDK